MLPITGWRIGYANGTTFSSAQGGWAKAPSTGVQYVIYYHEGSYTDVVLGEDSYNLPGQRASLAKTGSLIGEYDPTLGVISKGEQMVLDMLSAGLKLPKP